MMQLVNEPTKSEDTSFIDRDEDNSITETPYVLSVPTTSCGL